VYHNLFKFLKGLLFAGAFLLISSYVVAQNNSRAIDSLKSLVESKTGLDRFDVLYELTFEYLASGDYENALRNIELAQPVAYEIGDSLRIVKSGRVRSQILRRLDRTGLAIQQFLEILPIAKRNVFISEYSSILNGIGVAYTLQSEYDNALKYHFENLVALEKSNDDKSAIFETLNNIGLVYYKLKDFDKALEFYFRALEVGNQLERFNFKPSLLINIALCFNQLQRYSEAKDYVSRAFAACGDNCSEKIQIEGYNALGTAYFRESEPKKDTATHLRAKEYFERSLALTKNTNDKRLQIENLIYLAKIGLAIGEEENSLSALNEAEAIARTTQYNLLLISIYKEFSSLYNKLADYQKAAVYQGKYIELKDSLYSEELIKNLSRIQTEYEERQNIATIASNEQVIKQQRDLNVSFAIIALLAGLLILLVQRSNRTIKRVNVALSDAKNTIEEQNAKLQILNTDLDAEVKLKTSDLEKANQSLHRVVEELDNFIYKTSHDIRGPLASLKGICNIALLDVKDEVALKYLYKLDVTAEKLNTILTRLLIVNQINNSSLKTDELVNFEQVVNDVLLLERKKGLPPRLKIDKFIEKDLRFFSDKEFVRIILENLIDNAIKFYNDSERIEPFVKIYISKEKEQIIIRVIDNGIGISEIHPDKIFQMFSRASERSETGGIGLFITKTATEKLGGSVSLKTTPEGFTEFFVRFNVDGDGWRR
jgi:signal transduction histidine kinase/Tfp pilus assembly protein PilF